MGQLRTQGIRCGATATLLVALLTGLPRCTAPATGAERVARRAAKEQQVILATVQVGRGPLGIAIAGDGSRVYVANSASDTVAVIDGTSNQVVATVDAGKSPHDVAVAPNSGRLYMANTGLHDVKLIRKRLLGLFSVPQYAPQFAVGVLDTATDQVIANIIVGTNPWRLAVNEKTGRVYVANYGSHSVSVIDEQASQVVHTIHLGRFCTPASLAVDTATNRLYITSTLHIGPLEFGSGQLLVVDGVTHEVLDRIPVGRWAQVAVDKTAQRVYVTNPQRGTLTIVDGASGEVSASVVIGSDPRAVAVDEAAGLVYVASHDERRLSVVDAQAGALLRTIDVGTAPAAVAVSERTQRVYVTNSADDTLSVLCP